ncbi:hypothetical protein MtrunA17_Chr8g0342761 [Medicago truncatula]|uniref:Uncharacterized protein n=1 Tax=Medicago truncatula TaxID=3880 RepID=A0A396GGN4_MEDTR|nr:hypothetical protein MtrunA17_Chr8g0342761 [Medicago truncatula]
MYSKDICNCCCSSTSLRMDSSEFFNRLSRLCKASLTATSLVEQVAFGEDSGLPNRMLSSSAKGSSSDPSSCLLRSVIGAFSFSCSGSLIRSLVSGTMICSPCMFGFSSGFLVSSQLSGLS